MTYLPANCVFDASVLIKVILLEDYTDEVRKHFLRIGVDAEIHAPDLLPIECTNILWKQVMRNGYDASRVQQDLTDLLQLAVYWHPTMALLPRAADVAVSHGITAYDATYVALAEHLNIPLLTADDKLVRKLAGQFTVISLTDHFTTSTS